MHTKLWILALSAGIGLTGCDVQNAAGRGGFTVDIGSGYRGRYQRHDYSRIGYRREQEDDDNEGFAGIGR